MAKDRSPQPRQPQPPQPQQPQQGQLSVSATAMWQGPIPPAHEMGQYEQVLPGSADRIVAMAESQATHRQNLEATVVAANISSEARGQRYGLAVVVAGFGFSGWMVAIGESAAAAAVIIGQLATLAGVFVFGRYQQRLERERRFEQLSLFPVR